MQDRKQFAGDTAVVELIGGICLPIVRAASRIGESDAMQASDPLRRKHAGEGLPTISRLRFAIDFRRRSVRSALDIADAGLERDEDTALCIDPQALNLGGHPGPVKADQISRRASRKIWPKIRFGLIGAGVTAVAAMEGALLTIPARFWLGPFRGGQGSLGIQVL